MRRILFLIPVLKDGSGVFLTKLAAGLKTRGWEIYLASASRSGSWVEWHHLKESFKDIANEIYEMDFFDRSSPSFWSNLKKLMDVLGKEVFDVLAPQSCVPAAACLCARDMLGLKVPVILTLHSWGINRPEWMDLWDSWVLSRVDHICFVSHGYRESLIERLPFELSLDKTSVITPGLYIDDSYPSKEALRMELSRRYGIAPSSLWLSTLGGVSDRKGHRELVGAFKRFLDRGYDAYLFVIGPIREIDYFKGIISEYRGVLGRLRFMGQMKDPYSLIKASDLFIFPSKSEGLGLALMEAMALGVPCISSSIEGTKDLVCDGKYAFPLREVSEDAILEALIYAVENYGEMCYISNRARERVMREFSFDRTVRLYEDLYEKALKGVLSLT